MNRTTRVLLTFVSMFVLATSGCDAVPKNGDMVNSIASIVGEWTLATFGDEAAPIIEGAQAAGLNIGADGRISGSTGLNRLSGSLDLDALAQGKFSLSPMATTRMAGPPEVMALEQRFLEALGAVTEAKVDGGQLDLLGEAGAKLLGFTRG